MFDVTVKKLMPEASHTKLPGLCKTRWVERHTCFEVFLELYEPLVTFLDAILFPDEYSELRCVSQPDGRWNWNNDTRIKAQGLKASLSSFQTIATFIITKNVLDEVQSLSVKLQKRDQDVYEALEMVHQVIKRLTELRSKFDVVFSSQMLQLADDIGVSESIPRKTKLQRNKSNTHSYSPQEHYRRVIAIPLLDSLKTQLNERFTGDQNQNQKQHELLPIHYSLWNDNLPFPRSLGGEIDRWKRLWNDIPGESSRNTPCNFLEALALCDSLFSKHPSTLMHSSSNQC